MALIQCPDCGREVSDRAPVCPTCGCPIKKPEGFDLVTIRISTPALVTLYIVNVSTKEILWSGSSGSVAKFKVPKPTEIVIANKMDSKHPERIPAKNRFMVEAGKKYQYKFVQKFFGGDYVMNEVEYIDAD